MGAAAWYDHWLARIEELRGAVASFLGGSPAELALLPSTSAALSVVAESVAAKGRDRVVVSELDFPTLVYQWRVKPEIEVVVVPSDDGVSIDPARWEEAVDERTLFLATSHVFFTTGFIQDLPTLADVARRAGARCLIDGYQGAGQVPVDVRESGVDVYTAGPLKWLCGGPGLAYLWVREESIREMRPRITSWFATKDPFAFDAGTFEYRDDARRFELGTPALPTVHTALGGQELIDEAGIGWIRERNRLLTDRLIEALEERGFGVTAATDPARRSAIAMVRHADPAGAVERLAAEGVVVDHRPGHVRVSPHFYNTADEVDHFVEALERTRA